jgi:hypothetical protein
MQASQLTAPKAQRPVLVRPYVAGSPRRHFVEASTQAHHTPAAAAHRAKRDARRFSRPGPGVITVCEKTTLPRFFEKGIAKDLRVWVGGN